MMVNSESKGKTLLQTTSNKMIKQGFVDGPDGQIHYWTAGQGPALFLIHQSSASVEEYARLVPFLSEKFQLITFDLPGHGASDDPSEELGVDGFSSSAIEVLNHLSIEKCHVLGHHGGALIAMNLGWKHPNRIDRIILSGTSGLKSKQEKEAFANRLKKKHDRLEHDGESIFTAWKRYVKYLPDAHPEEVLVTFINNIQTRLRPYDAHSKILEWDRRPALEYLKGPILLMQGDLDNFVSNQESLLDILPKETKRIVINSGGAFMFYDKAELCSLAIAEFIESSSF